MPESIRDGDSMTRTLLICLAAGLVLTAAQRPLLAEEISPKRRFELYQEYMDRDVFVKEGIGLKAVKLGQPFGIARQAWGRPLRVTSKPLIGGARHWYFRADRWTDVRLSGDETIEAMAFLGMPGSPYETATGARFGMPMSQIIAFYGNANMERTEDSLTYAAKGVRFRFEKGLLREFEVFLPN
jgi:hypothetical protein